MKEHAQAQYLNDCKDINLNYLYKRYIKNSHAFHPPMAKHWYTKLWAFYVMARLTDSLKSYDNDTGSEAFIAVWYLNLTFLFGNYEFPKGE